MKGSMTTPNPVVFFLYGFSVLVMLGFAFLLLTGCTSKPKGPALKAVYFNGVQYYCTDEKGTSL